MVEVLIPRLQSRTLPHGKPKSHAQFGSMCFLEITSSSTMPEPLCLRTSGPRFPVRGVQALPLALHGWADPLALTAN
jgi:hypothetical protein